MPNKYDFEIVKRGYDMDEVDRQIEKLESIIRSYNDKDSAIKNAILSAQVAADGIIRNAKNRSYEIKENSIKKIQEIAGSIANQKQMLKAFQEEYMRQVVKYLHEVNEKDFAAIYKKIDSLENYLSKYSQSDDVVPLRGAPTLEEEDPIREPFRQQRPHVTEQAAEKKPVEQKPVEKKPVEPKEVIEEFSFDFAPSTEPEPDSQKAAFKDRPDDFSFLDGKDELSSIFDLD